MNNPFLIVGYERSGTTLVRRIMSMHPGLRYDIVHENYKTLLRCVTKRDAVKKLTYPAKQAGELTGGTMSVLAGQKIPYLKFPMIKGTIAHFVGLFPNAFIIHIIRDPINTINSQVKTFNKRPGVCVSRYFASVPKVTKYLSKTKRVATIRYEDLVGRPTEVITKLYEWMGDAVDQQHIERVMTTKDPWQCDGRMMCGLRYFDSIQLKTKPITLSGKIVDNIKKQSKTIKIGIKNAISIS